MNQYLLTISWYYNTNRQTDTQTTHNTVLIKYTWNEWIVLMMRMVVVINIISSNYFYFHHHRLRRGIPKHSLFKNITYTVHIYTFWKYITLFWSIIELPKTNHFCLSLESFLFLWNVISWHLSSNIPLYCYSRVVYTSLCKLCCWNKAYSIL